MKRSFLCVAFLLVGCAVPVPDSGHSGFLLGSPVGITSSVRPSITTKCAGFSEAEPGSDCTPPAGQPQFDRFLPDVFGPTPHPVPPILAMSLGIDVIVVTALPPGGVVVEDGVSVDDTTAVLAATLPGFGGWMAFQFSVNSVEVGPGLDVGPPEVAFDIHAAHKKKPSELDRTVFSYLLPGDTPTLHKEFESVSAMGPETLGLLPPEGEAPGEIHALNMHVALYATDLSAHAGVFTTRPLPTSPWIYFTLRPEFLNASPGLSWLGPSPDSGTIYRSLWGAGKWGTPSPYRTWLELGLQQVEPELRIIDGLAIDAVNPTNPIGHEILFSLGPTIPPEQQIQYVEISAAPNPPRRVVLKRRGGDYGSLGKELGAGSGVGDFCTKDPDSITSGMGPPPVLDDYFVARRVPPSAPPDPMLMLAVSGYRQRVGGVPTMRTCMSWPNPAATSGEARVRWGSMRDFNIPGTIVWDLGESPPIAYAGKPLSADRPLTSATPVKDDRRAMIAQWHLIAGDKTYVSAISALRY